MATQKPATILIAGGGTGGHFFSGVAVGEAFAARSPQNRVVYVGTRQGIEAREGGKSGLDVRFVSVAGIAGRSLRGKLGALLRLPLALLQSVLLLWKERPVCVVGVGGYASGPVVLAARLLGFPTGIVEQNSVAGRTNRILGKFVHRVFVAFPHARGSFPEAKVRVTGNPIREGVVNLLTLESTGTVGVGDRLKLLVVGGSQGAKALNEGMMEAAGLVPDELKRRLHVTHQTGAPDEARVREAYEKAGVAAKVVPFIDAMAEAYRAADLVLCRAGALTVSELSISRRGALLVPYPHAIDNHQEWNARALVDEGGGELLPQSELSGQRIVDALRRFDGDRKKLQEMAWKAGALARPQAASEVADEMCRIAGVP
jgi:UDP-N-acetylglucosamine--N-acetylmuramyl-(pentapeptide) pyrophosphoryl-undecaprenol N-acetylglucosamine transferase